MPRTSAHRKEASFNLRVDPELKKAFTAATEAEDKPAAQVVREFMRDYVKQRERAAFVEQARRDCLAANDAAQDPNSDEAQVMRELEADLADWAED